jgi:heat-inducible transcriptional repressor
MTQPEFRDVDNLKGLMQVIEDRSGLLDWITAQGETEGIVITIGKELDGVDLNHCSLVTSTYKVGRVKGTIGVLGPTRMPYSKLVSVVDYTSRMLTRILSQ